jgi:hypothetical protein
MISWAFSMHDNSQIDNKLVDLGQRIMGSVAIRLDALEIGTGEKTPNPELELVATEYYMLRIYLVDTPPFPYLNVFLLTTSN